MKGVNMVSINKISPILTTHQIK